MIFPATNGSTNSQSFNSVYATFCDINANNCKVIRIQHDRYNLFNLWIKLFNLRFVEHFLFKIANDNLDFWIVVGVGHQERERRYEICFHPPFCGNAGLVVFVVEDCNPCTVRAALCALQTRIEAADFCVIAENPPARKQKLVTTNKSFMSPH